MAAKSNRSGMFERLAPALLILSVVLAFFVGVLWQKVSSLEKSSTSTDVIAEKAQAGNDAPAPNPAPNGLLTEEQVKAIPEVTDSDHIRGPKDAKVLFIEYSDLECPFCKRFHPDVVRLMEEYDGKIAWVYRHFPLDMLHSKARVEAQATECAADQGGEVAFWNLTDKIYEVTPANNGLELDQLPKLAEEVGLDSAKLQECIDAEKFADKVESDYQSGLKAGVNGTPGNFIITTSGKGWSIPGALPYETLKQNVDEALGS
jgi:protein-disulfide isomerase